MESSSVLSSIQNLVSLVKKEIFSNETSNFAAFVSASAYDTAWLAMIPDHENKEVQQAGPMFKSCLDWVIENQREGGFWGEITDGEGSPTIDALPATLACLLALNTWNKGQRNVQLGLEFMNSKAEILVQIKKNNLPRWFILTFPAMTELAEAQGLNLAFAHRLSKAVADISIKRQQILETEELVDESECFPPLLSYLETLPSSYNFNRQKIVKQYLSSDGSLFQSPSATARAFMDTGNVNCIKYLRYLVSEFPNGGVPATYPMDEDVIKLCMVDHVQRLGLAEYFNQEIGQILAQIYRNQKDYYDPNLRETRLNPAKLFKDSLAFRLLRMQGHYVNPGSFCWFLHEAETVAYMEENCEEFVSAMYSVYRATDLSFPGEDELERARTFAVKMLQKSNYTKNRDHIVFVSNELQNMIKYELKQPWIARLDHLYHRKWIEENNTSPLWIGKASFYRLSCLDNKNLMQLAVEHFEYQQCIYGSELEELKGWSKKWGLSEMGFGREKTTYTYFATAASTSCLPFDSITRLAVAKAAIIVTVADDFYDMEGSLSQLEILTDAVKRWDNKGLEGHAKTIFDALDAYVNDMGEKCHTQQRSIVVAKIQDIWRETFKSWMVERRWSLAGYIPSMDAYLQTGMISIAAHTIVLPAASFLNPSSTGETLMIKPVELHNITKLLMAITRLVNDTQSFQKEIADGKMNLVSIHLHENPTGRIHYSVDYVKGILEDKRKEFLEHVFMDDDMPRSWKQTHLSCMKVFQMFFNSGNLFDSEAVLLDDIKRAIYLPIDRKHSKQALQETLVKRQLVPAKPFLKPPPSSVVPSDENEKEINSKVSGQFRRILNHQPGFNKLRFVKISSSAVTVGREKIPGAVPMRPNMRFI